jgi:hypothetical protein
MMKWHGGNNTIEDIQVRQNCYESARAPGTTADPASTQGRVQPSPRVPVLQIAPSREGFPGWEPARYKANTDTGITGLADLTNRGPANEDSLFGDLDDNVFGLDGFDASVHTFRLPAGTNKNKIFQDTAEPEHGNKSLRTSGMQPKGQSLLDTRRRA